MMKKIDQENPSPNAPPLLSQNISIVEVGAHSQVFEKFISFAGIKTLILTDIDTGCKVPKLDDKKQIKINKTNNEVSYTTEKCRPNDTRADHTSNNALTFFHDKARTELNYFLELSKENKTLTKDEGKWKADHQGYLYTAFQTEENGYRGRSFEDSFFFINKDFFRTNTGNFQSLTPVHFESFITGKSDAFELAENGVKKKTSLAIEILLNSKPHGKLSFSNWNTPHYIQEGLEWLRD